jgi:FkbH-like protein
VSAFRAGYGANLSDNPPAEFAVAFNFNISYRDWPSAPTSSAAIASNTGAAIDIRFLPTVKPLTKLWSGVSGGKMAASDELEQLRQRLVDQPLTLADIYRIGQQVHKAASRLDSAAVDGDAGSMPSQRIAVLGGLNIDYLAWGIACAALQEGVAPVIYRCPYGAYAQEILDPGSALYQFRPTVTVIAIDWRDVVEQLAPSSAAEQVTACIDGKLRFFEQLWSLLADRTQCKIIQHLLVPPAWGGRGVAERLAAASPIAQVRQLNERLLEAGAGVHWVEMDRLAQEIGSRRWASERLYHAAKLAFDPRFMPDYLPYFRAAWRSAFGAVKKALVLDLDNTLWGGVIGDDGVDGIKLGPGCLAGEAFAAWGQYVAELRARGVVLAVCSKNDAAIAASGFEHPHAKLQIGDFATFECSWNDKVSGMRRIAQALNLGLEALVFADDNPMECALVARELPQIAVVPLGAEPTEFIEILESGHWFDLPRYTTEDFGRGEAYSALRQAEQERQNAPDMGSFLRDLRMVGDLCAPAISDLDRLAQLELKTNQFNMTTRRYSGPALAGLMKRNDVIMLALRLSDRLANHGLVSTLIAIHDAETVRIDSWLMSCRVFSRTAEQFMIHHLAQIARERGARRLVGEYLPTAKNDVVANLYGQLGFDCPNGDGRFWWRDIAADSLSDLKCFIDATVGEAAEYRSPALAS